MPSLDNIIKHQRMTPLTKSIGKKIVSAANNLPKKTSVIMKSFKFLDLDPINHLITPAPYLTVTSRFQIRGPNYFLSYSADLQHCIHQSAEQKAKCVIRRRIDGLRSCRRTNEELQSALRC
jgi:hypothetical protein